MEGSFRLFLTLWTAVGFYAGHPGEEGPPHGPSLEGVEQTGNCGPGLSALPGAFPWRRLWGPHKEEAPESSGLLHPEGPLVALLPITLT